ncbi:hypothetical protein CYY_006653 [Polysphondylium violaceum]|uniref:Uncharacterized protein n=1 Tax=Polysphondylium violaceum TaxID=133409 RepID=A0A8J4PT32_9MYCE|nr:hypothetical protein CYY_006653 [Polysphondylium violaceum]
MSTTSSLSSVSAPTIVQNKVIVSRIFKEFDLKCHVNVIPFVCKEWNKWAKDIWIQFFFAYLEGKVNDTASFHISLMMGNNIIDFKRLFKSLFTYDYFSAIVLPEPVYYNDFKMFDKYTRPPVTAKLAVLDKMHYVTNVLKRVMREKTPFSVTSSTAKGHKYQYQRRDHPFTDSVDHCVQTTTLYHMFVSRQKSVARVDSPCRVTSDFVVFNCYENSPRDTSKTRVVSSMKAVRFIVDVEYDLIVEHRVLQAALIEIRAKKVDLFQENSSVEDLFSQDTVTGYTTISNESFRASSMSSYKGLPVVISDEQHQSNYLFIGDSGIDFEQQSNERVDQVAGDDDMQETEEIDEFELDDKESRNHHRLDYLLAYYTTQHDDQCSIYLFIPRDRVTPIADFLDIRGSELIEMVSMFLSPRASPNPSFSQFSRAEAIYRLYSKILSSGNKGLIYIAKEILGYFQYYSFDFTRNGSRLFKLTCIPTNGNRNTEYRVRLSHDQHGYAITTNFCPKNSLLDAIDESYLPSIPVPYLDVDKIKELHALFYFHLFQFDRYIDYQTFYNINSRTNRVSYKNYNQYDFIDSDDDDDYDGGGNS